LAIAYVAKDDCWKKGAVDRRAALAHERRAIRTRAAHLEFEIVLAMKFHLPLAIGAPAAPRE
jgi:hypothetical protein